jgi:hypothetical protein
MGASPGFRHSCSSVVARLFAAGLVSALASNAGAQIQVIEPDAYTNGTVLDNILPGVHLTTAGADNLPIPPVTFEVTASDDILDLAPTGTNVFGHAGVPFWNTDRRLRMEFNSPVSFVEIDFAGGQFFTNETGRLDAYNAGGQLIASYITAPQPAGGIETMTITRPSADITLAIAYVPPDGGVFGRLDRLRFGQALPPAPSISGIAPGPNGSMVLSFNGQFDSSYRVWASTNLLDWSVLGTASQAPPGAFSYEDTGASGHPLRFYRVSSP